MKDILELLYHEHPFNEKNVETIAVGKRFIGVMLKSGNIGVASTLKEQISINPLEVLSKPNFSCHANRILVNAWVNANVNYLEPISGTGDIFEAIPFNEFKNVVMVGCFKSLADKFDNKELKLSIFDLNEKEKPIEPIENQRSFIEKADCVILTSTTIANGTFRDLISYPKSGCKVYLLGPSTPLSSYLIDKLGVTGLFGARFKPFDYEVLKAIEMGGGTKSFLPNMYKAYMLNN